MTAAVYAARKMLKTLLITRDIGGQVNQTANVENYMGYQFIMGPELMEKFETQMRNFPIEIQTNKKVSRVSPADGTIKLTAESGEAYEGKTVIVATGKRARELNVPGERQLVGRGVSFCAICDGPIFQGMKVLVVGGGNSALEAVNDIIKYTEHVYLVSVTPLTSDKILIERVKNSPNLTMLLGHEIVEILGAKTVEAVVVRSIETGEVKKFDVKGVFVEIGLIPNSDLVKGVVNLNKNGEIEINHANETGVPGLYAAGDVTSIPEKQIVVAAGEGAKALLQAHRYLQRLGA